MEKKICKIKNCNKKVKGHGLCPMHLRRFRVHGNANYDRSKINPICSVLGCNEKRKTKGMCSSHYHKQFHKENYIYAIKKEKIILQCKESNCTKNATTKGYCQKHYLRKVKSGQIITKKRNIHKPCSVDGCDNKSIARGYCEKHYRKFKIYGDPLFTKHHLMSNTSEYHTWNTMIQRTINPNNISYKYYGGRGITVCDRWLHSFNNFYEDMGDKPFKGAELDREKNNLGYNKDNCRWVTPAINCQNKSNNKLNKNKVNSIRNEYPSKNMYQLAKTYNVSVSTISLIINNKRWI